MAWMLLFAIYLICSFENGMATNRKYNFSYADLESCKEYDTKVGYGYHQYFAIETMKDVQFPNNSFQVNLFVLAGKDALILLSPTDNHASAVYEIALGAGSNTFAEIRRQRQMYPLRTVRVRNLLSALNPLPITITYLNGLIDVRIKGQENPIISVTDDDPLTINYISFSSWGNSEGKWFFDCAGDENRLKVVEPPNRTAIEKLRDALFTDYDANMVPMNLSNVFWKFNLKFADFDAKKAQIVTRGKFRASWIDPKMVWEPKNFSNINVIHIQTPNVQIWTPQIRLLHGASNDFKSLNLKFALKINSSGQITAESRDATFSTWCNGMNRDWPIEQIRCAIVMMFDDYTGLEFSPGSFDTNEDVKERFNFDEAQYHIVAIANHPNANRTFFDTVNDEWPVEYTQFIFEITMERNGSFYTRLFVTPLFGATVMILLSLWTERYLRVTLNSIGLLILMAMHILLAEYGPHGYVPLLVIYYNCTLIAAWVTLCLFIMSCCIKEYAGTVERFAGVLKLSWLRLMLGMDVLSSNGYSHLRIETTPNDDLRKFIDRIAFMLVIFIIGIFASIGY